MPTARLRVITLIAMAFATAACGSSPANPTGAPSPAATTPPSVAAATPAPTAAPPSQACPAPAERIPATIAGLAIALELSPERLGVVYTPIPLDVRGSVGQKVDCVRPAIIGGFGVRGTLAAMTVKALYAACEQPAANAAYAEIVCGEREGSTTDDVDAAIFFVDLASDPAKPFAFKSTAFGAHNVKADGSILDLAMTPGDRFRVIGITPGNPRTEYVDAVALRFIDAAGEEGAALVVFRPAGTYLPTITAQATTGVALGTSAFGTLPNLSVGPDSPLPREPFEPQPLP